MARKDLSLELEVRDGDALRSALIPLSLITSSILVRWRAHSLLLQSFARSESSGGGLCAALSISSESFEHYYCEAYDFFPTIEFRELAKVLSRIESGQRLVFTPHLQENRAFIRVHFINRPRDPVVPEIDMKILSCNPQLYRFTDPSMNCVTQTVVIKANRFIDICHALQRCGTKVVDIYISSREVIFRAPTQSLRILLGPEIDECSIVDELRTDVPRRVVMDLEFSSSMMQALRISRRKVVVQRTVGGKCMLTCPVPPLGKLTYYFF